MFDNLSVDSSSNEKEININIQWRWRVTDPSSPPSCKVFCCAIPENHLLEELLFGYDEIINWINSEVVDISSPETRIQNLQDYYNKPANNRYKCWLNQYCLNSNGNIREVQRMRFGSEDADKIFFVCVYGQNNFQSMVVSVTPECADVPYEIKTVRTSLFGPKVLEMHVNQVSDRRLVLVTTSGGEEVYSMLPSGFSNYYFDSDVQPGDIKKLTYLSSLIGH